MNENGANVDECKDQITEIGVQGKPHNMFPFIQSKIEKITMIKILLKTIPIVFSARGAS